MKADEFQIGDRVVLIEKEAMCRIKVGDVGTVCVSSPRFDLAGVSWDRRIDGHDCGGACPRGYGWNVPRRCIDLLEDDSGFTFDQADFERLILGGRRL